MSETEADLRDLASWLLRERLTNKAIVAEEAADRLAALEQENARLREALRKCADVLFGLLTDGNDPANRKVERALDTALAEVEARKV